MYTIVGSPGKHITVRPATAVAVNSSSRCEMDSSTDESSATRPSSKQCLVAGCTTPLSTEPRHCLLRGLCAEHMKADAVQKRDQEEGDALFRYCQQCGKLEPLDLFDGHKRSCRVQLAKRRAASSSKFTQASTSRSSGSGDTSTNSLTNSLRPMRAGVRKAITCSSLDVLMLRAQQQQQQRQEHAEVNNRLLSLQQQLLELESHVGLITQQQHARNQLAFLQQQYDTLLLEAVALQRQHQQQHQLQQLQQPVHMPSVDVAAAAAALGGYAAGGLGMAALSSHPAAAALPAVFAAPTASRVVPMVVPGAAFGAAAAAAAASLGVAGGLLLPSAPAAAAANGLGHGTVVGTAVQSVQANLAGLRARLERALSTGLGLALEMPQGLVQVGLQQYSGDISSGSSGNAHAERTSLVRFHSLGQADAASAAAAAAACCADAVQSSHTAHAAAAGAASVAAGSATAAHAALQGPSDQEWDDLLLGDLPDLQDLLSGDNGLLHPSTEQQTATLRQPQRMTSPNYTSTSQRGLLQVQPALNGIQDSYSAANTAADGGRWGSAQQQMLLAAPQQQQPQPQLLAAYAQPAAAAVAMPAAAGVGGLEPWRGSQHFLPPTVQQHGMVGFTDPEDFAGLLDELLVGMQGHAPSMGALDALP